MMSMMRLALASKSPRRRELLRMLGWDHFIVDVEIDETAADGETPSQLVQRLAEAKAAAGSITADGHITIGADTTVDVDGVMFAKPKDRSDAARMLRILSGRRHLVHTGIALAKDGAIIDSNVETTAVFFGELSDDDIAAFISTGECDDKAGAYAAQGCGSVFISRIEGCFYNVVGLPVYALKKMIEKIYRS